MTEPYRATRSGSYRPTLAQDDLAQRADDASEVSRSAGKVPLKDMSDDLNLNPSASLAGMTEPPSARPSAPHTTQFGDDAFATVASNSDKHQQAGTKASGNLTSAACDADGDFFPAYQ